MNIKQCGKATAKNHRFWTGCNFKRKIDNKARENPKNRAAKTVKLITMSVFKSL